MPTNAEIIEGSQDLATLGQIINGAADLNGDGRVTSRQGRVFYTLARILQQLASTDIGGELSDYLKEAKLSRDGSQAMTGKLRMGNNPIESVANADTDDDAPNYGQVKSYVDGEVSDASALAFAYTDSEVGQAAAAASGYTDSKVGVQRARLDKIEPVLKKLADYIKLVGDDGIPEGAQLALIGGLEQIVLALYADGIEMPGFRSNRPENGSTPGATLTTNRITSAFKVRDNKLFLGPLEIRATRRGGVELRCGGRIMWRWTNDNRFASRRSNAVFILEEDGADGQPRRRIDTTPLFGDHLFLVNGRPLTLYPQNLLRLRSDQEQALVSLQSLPASDEVAAFSDSQTREPLRLDPVRIAPDGATTLTVRKLGDRLNRVMKPLTVMRCAVPFATDTPVNIALFGDSLTHRLVPSRLDTKLRSFRIIPSFVGTVRGLTKDNVSNGPRCEGRESWSTSDFIGDYNPSVVYQGVLPNGQEDAYIASNHYDNMSATQVFLNPDINAGSQSRVVTINGTPYRMDFNYWRQRFNLLMPDIVVINLGMNNSFRLSGAASMLADLPIILAEARRAFPDAYLLLWATPTAGSPDGDDLWLKHYRTIAAINQVVRNRRDVLNDSRVFLCSAWAFMSVDVGWQMTAGTTDDDGNTTTTIADPLHPLTAGAQGHEALAQAIANIVSLSA